MKPITHFKSSVELQIKYARTILSQKTQNESDAPETQQSNDCSREARFTFRQAATKPLWLTTTSVQPWPSICFFLVFHIAHFFNPKQNIINVRSLFLCAMYLGPKINLVQKPLSQELPPSFRKQPRNVRYLVSLAPSVFNNHLCRSCEWAVLAAHSLCS